MSQRPWYRFFPGDYAADTAGLSMAEHGAYRLLLDAYYAGRKPLPNNPRFLYQICHTTSKRERRMVDAILVRFFTLLDDGWHNAKADDELGENASTSERLHARAVRAAEARWGKERDASSNATSIRPPDASSTPQAMLGDAKSRIQSPDTREDKDKGTPLAPNGIGRHPIAHGWHPSSQCLARVHMAGKPAPTEDQINSFVAHYESIGEQRVDWDPAFVKWCIGDHARRTTHQAAQAREKSGAKRMADKITEIMSNPENTDATEH